MTSVPKLTLTIDDSNVIEGAKEVLKVIRPQWTSESVNFKLFTDGITNKLVGCFNQSDNNASSDVVLIRVYGNKTDLLIDRHEETKNIILLHKHGYAPALYATFINGLAYEYVSGNTLTPESCREESIWKLVAKRMAQMHKVVDESSVIGIAALPKKMEKFLKLIPDVFSDPVKNSRISQIFPSAMDLRSEFKHLYGKLQKLNSPIVFCHNDLLLGNVIHTADKNRVTFIDYEYAAYNHQAFDIGNHFTEFAGIDQIDYDRYPSKEFQLQWLSVYLEEFNGCQSSSNEVEKLYVDVNQFALASHLLWTVWALIQAEHSTIDFDFVRFGEMRYTEYVRRKEEFLSLNYKD
ncbi:ethanolamine kinase [Uranotaenia lowii]|uniref:ethanolamine kinase n=1 Tax=Uranotaenia lowii TaxID=190385 RepID=UPI002479C090|nr:ethanolamine kinase [Uranotaenia lowii]